MQSGLVWTILLRALSDGESREYGNCTPDIFPQELYTFENRSAMGMTLVGIFERGLHY